MQKFEGISFVWALAIVAVGVLIFGLRAFFEHRRLENDAEKDFEFKSRQSMLDTRLTKTNYVRAYKRFYAPRGKTYVAGALGAILLLTFPAFGLINFLLLQIWNLTGRNDIYAPNFMVGQFITFFMIIATWVIIIYIAMREYHRRAPVSFKRELARELGED